MHVCVNMFGTSKRIYLLLAVISCFTVLVLRSKVVSSYQTLQEAKYVSKSFESTTTLVRWKPDWMANASISQLFETRNARIWEICVKYESKINVQIKSLQGVSDNLKNGNRIVSSSKHKLSICIVPKVSSTYWHYFMQHLVSVTNSKFKFTSVEKAWRDASKSEVFAYINRNPWHRIVSVYIEKMSSAAAQEQRDKFLRFCQEFREPADQAILSFEQFLNCAITNMESGRYNIHWEPVYLRCDICHHAYTAPVMLENMEAEATFLLNSVGIQNGKSLMVDVRNQTIRKVEKRKLSSNYIKYFSSLRDQSLINRFRAVYNIELELFNYPKSPFEVASPT